MFMVGKKGYDIMWQKSYRDYKPDEPLVKQKVITGKNIIGCEMHELNGWGESYHRPRKKNKKKGLFRTLIDSFFSVFRRNK